MNGEIVVIATRNQGKVKEFAGWFAGKGMQVRSLADYEGIPEIVEDGDTFVENALIKATIVSRHLGLPVLADDSGLSVGMLGGDPGVRSARYAGEHAKDGDNNRKLLEELGKLSEPAKALGENHPAVYSSAAFICALALVDPAGGEPLTTEGRCEGYILGEAKGNNGFGYDPLFYLPEFGRTMAELSVEEKNRISHRGQAIQRLSEMMGK